MLIITRRQGESFFIGDEVEIVLLETGSQVRIGINAPKDVEVVRTELFVMSSRMSARSERSVRRRVMHRVVRDRPW